MKKCIFRKYTEFLLISSILLLALPLSFPFYVMLKSHELMHIEKVISLQIETNSPVLYGPAYSNASRLFKLKSVIARRPRVIALGSSRVMQFRSDFFKKDVNFYNAGGGIERIKQFSHFLKHIPVSQQPDIIIIGLDQYYYNTNWDNLRSDNAESAILSEIQPEIFSLITSRCWEVYKHYHEGKFNIRDLASSADHDRLIGLNAMVNRNGFKNDGSYYYGKCIANPNDPLNHDFQFTNTLSRIAHGNGRFEYGKDLSSGAVLATKDFLCACKERGIYVIGFLPPFAPEINLKLSAMPSQYAYMRHLAPTLAHVFKNEGFAFHDFTDIASLGASDAEFVDGFHGSDKAYLRLFIRMLEQDPRLGQYAQPMSYLKEKIAQSKSNYLVFGDDEYSEVP